MMNWLNWKLVVWVLAAIFGASLFGCTTSTATMEEQTAAAKRGMAYVAEAAKVAKEHGLSYQATVDITGRPGVGEDLTFYFDTGVRVRINFAGNAAKGPQ